MSDGLVGGDLDRPISGSAKAGFGGTAAVQYALAVGLVAAATVVAFVADHLVTGPDLALVFVIPVLISGLTVGWGPSLTAALLAVLTFDVLFLEPRFSLRVHAPADMLTLSLLLIVGAVASTVAGQSRQRAAEVQSAASRAQALQDLARLVARPAASAIILEGATTALAAIFGQPAVVWASEPDGSGRTFTSHGVRLSAADEEAARWVAERDLPTHGDTFPFERARFDFWPMGGGLVAGVQSTARHTMSPQESACYVDLVGGYLVSGLARAPA